MACEQFTAVRLSIFAELLNCLRPPTHPVYVVIAFSPNSRQINGDRLAT